SFRASAVLSVLLAFPTRRSSDLLRRRKIPADAGFGALAEFEGHTLHLVPGALVAELSRIEIAVLGAGTEVPGSDPAQFRDQSARSEEHTSELQSRFDLVCRLLLE